MHGRASFGELLRRHRLAAGVSQEALAELARMSGAAVGALERGDRRAPYRATVALLSDALKLSPAERTELETAAELGRGRRGRRGAEIATDNLPVRLTSFIGREAEIGEISSLLRAHRLVTLTGSGGIGKTRNAVETARRLLAKEYAEAWFVDLAPVEDGTFVSGAIASVVGVTLASVANPLPSLTAQLRTRAFLLILDNCEHVIAYAAAAAAAILRACPRITILATSRERLAIEGERVYRLPSLQEAEALQLLTDRAGASDATLTLTNESLKTGGEICRRLDGIPLAIELAATRVATLGLEALNARLKERLVIAGGRDLPQRQRTMLATIAWSYDLLSEPERALLRRISIFRGSVSLAAAEAVWIDHPASSEHVPELVSRLVDKSLLETSRIGESHRYVMLDSVRAFALEMLVAAGEHAPASKAQARWLARLADDANESYAVTAPSLWFKAYWPEIDNVRGALAWLLESQDAEDRVLAGRIVGGFRGLWTNTKRHHELLRWSHAALQYVDEQRNPQVVAFLLRAVIQSSVRDERQAALQRATSLFERIGDRQGLIGIHITVGLDCGARGDFEDAERAIARGFALVLDDEPSDAMTYNRLLHARSVVRMWAGNLDEAERDLRERARRMSTLGANPKDHSIAEATIAFSRGDFERAAAVLEEYVEYLFGEFDRPLVALSCLAATQIARGDLDAAKAAACEALELGPDEYSEWGMWTIQHLAAIGALRLEASSAARLLGFVDTWCRRTSRTRIIGFERTSFDILAASLREQLSAEAIAEAAAEGALLDWERAVDLARSL